MKKEADIIVDITVCILCTLLAFFAMIYDLRTYKIPNVLCVIGILSGIVFNIIFHGFSSVKNSLTGIVCPIGILFIFFCLRIIGAGDIKLLSAIGAFISFGVIKIIIITFVIAGTYAFVYVIVKLLRRLADKDKKSKYTFSRMHLSVSIFTALVVYTISELCI
ncbi:MAG: prepilin peptidase [Lachnospiraceae bacterium]|nr:prepilin peptidase [Lachnospiraceae bacterium]